MSTHAEITSSTLSANCENCWFNQSLLMNDANTHKILCKILKDKQTIIYKKGELLIKNGDPVLSLICIQNGIVKVSKKGNRNKELTLWIAGKGDIVGLNSFISDEPFSFNAIAVGEVKVCSIPVSELQLLLEKEPIVFIQLMKSVCSKLDFIEQRITSISQKKIREQCAELLISIAAKDDPENKKNGIIDYSINDLASLIGTTKSYLYKVLLEFTDKKILSVRNRKWTINNKDALSLIAAGHDK